MKTALITTARLDVPEYFDRTVKFVNYYQERQPEWEIFILEDASSRLSIKLFQVVCPDVTIIPFTKHYDRISMNHYVFAWRAVYFLKSFMDMWEYDKVIYANNDFFLLSDRIFDYVNALSEGWTTFYLPRHDANETDCFIVTRGCPEYEAYVASGNFYEHLGEQMEFALPITNVAKQFNGDRYGDKYKEIEPPKDWIGIDFFAQMESYEKIPCSP